MRKYIVVLILLVLCGAVGLFFALKDGDAADRASVATSEPSAAVPKTKTSPAKRTVLSESSGSRAKPVLSFTSDDEEDEDDELPPEQRLLADRIEKALDEESLSDAIACVDAALACPNTEIRQSMVDTLGWFGKEALPELTPFLADSDEDIRENAMNEWSMAVSSIENDEDKIITVECAMEILDDEDALEEISGEYIGIDEKLAVESLMRVIASGKSAQGVAKAKETYEFVTGEEWVDAAEAERWLAEEYEPPEGDAAADDGTEVEG